jgi:hypothetical protein
LDELIAVLALHARAAIPPVDSQPDDFGSETSNFRQNLVRFWKAVQFVLRENHVAVNYDVEDSAASTDQFRFDADLVFDCGRQTGSPG